MAARVKVADKAARSRVSKPRVASAATAQATGLRLHRAKVSRSKAENARVSSRSRVVSVVSVRRRASSRRLPVSNRIVRKERSSNLNRVVSNVHQGHSASSRTGRSRNVHRKVAARTDRSKKGLAPIVRITGTGIEGRGHRRKVNKLIG